MEIEAGLVDIWNGSLDIEPDTLQALLAVLNEGEKEKAGSFKLTMMRNRFIAVRGLLRQTLASYLATSPADLQFETGEFGKPRLACNSLYFNLSHTKDKLLIAVADFPDIGIDLEIVQPRPSLDKLAERVFSDSELHAWRQIRSEDRLACFYRLWTKKEAFVKAVGRGIALGLELCEFELGEGGQLLAIPNEYGSAADWLVSELDISPDASAALVTPKCTFELRQRPIEAG